MQSCWSKEFHRWQTDGRNATFIIIYLWYYKLLLSIIIVHFSGEQKKPEAFICVLRILDLKITL